MKLIKKLLDGNTLLTDNDYKRNGWRKVSIDGIKDDDRLFKNLDVENNSYWIADRNGYLVPKSEVYKWLNSYERPLPWQEAQDLSEKQHFLNILGDRNVHEIGELRDNLLTGLAIGIPTAALLAEGLILAPFTTSASLAGSVIGEKQFNKHYNGDWAEDLNKWTGIPKLIGEYLNPGTIIGGGITYPSLKLLGANKYKLLWKLPQTKRATEVAIRTSKGYDGLRSTLDALATSTGKDKLDVLNYILFNMRPKGKFYKTFGRNSQYTGLMKDLTYAEKELLGNDLVDAYIYGKEVSPKIADFIGTGDKVSDIGPHQEFIELLPKSKRKKVQIYKTKTPSQEKLASEELTTNKQTVVGKDGSLASNTEGIEINSGGHLVEINPETKTYRSSDAWKFGEDPYMNKWIYTKRNSKKTRNFWEYNVPFNGKNVNVLVTPWNTRINVPIGNFNLPINLNTDKILRTGLKIAELGNPIITVTPPVPY